MVRFLRTVFESRIERLLNELDDMHPRLLVDHLHGLNHLGVAFLVVAQASVQLGSNFAQKRHRCVKYVTNTREQLRKRKRYACAMRSKSNTWVVGCDEHVMFDELLCQYGVQHALFHTH
jgi:hypothetical protein